jgi:tetratricopeptide (TPR) repeat protein/transcriptional regulator with XRE-family HTH domain
MLTSAFRMTGVGAPQPSFGEAVRVHRLRRRMSQDELSAVTGIATRSLRNIEAGRVAQPRGSTVRLLADAFGLHGPEREAFLAGMLRASPAAAAAPAQLPRDLAAFAGRTADLARLAEALERNSIPVISGTAGVGKTTLAVHWAHRIADRFPDGQLYVNLHGFGPGDAAVAPEDALADFLTALGMPPDAIPGAAASRVAAYRSRLAGTRVLVVLDNARDSEHVRPLLPAAGGCLAIVTSRDRLTGLIATEGATPVPLGVLSDQDAADLLMRRLGARRLADEPDAVDDLVARCDRLPLALSVVAARAAVDSGVSLAAMAGELRHPEAALDALTAGDAATEVRSVFSWSYRSLPAPARTVFQAVGLHPGPDVDLYAAANLAGLPAAETRRAFAELGELHLVTPRPGGRYATHDLLRAYAGEVARAELAPGEVRAALDRLFRFYQHAVVVRFGEYFLGRIDWPRDPGAPDVPLPDDARAEVWAEAERVNLVATVVHAAGHGHFGYATTVANCFSSYLSTHGYSAESLTVTAVAVDAARGEKDALAEAVALGDLAGTLMRYGRYAETIDRAEESVRLMRSVGATRHEARMLGNLAEAYATVGDMGTAGERARASLGLAHRLDDSFMIALARMRLAALARDRGDLDEALEHATVGLDAFAPHTVEQVRGDLLMTRGSVHLWRGEHDLARQFLLRAQALLRTVGQTGGTLAWTLNHLARLSRLEGAGQAAARYLEESLTLARAIDDPELQADALTELALLKRDRGDTAAGIRDAEAALALATDLRHPRQEMLARLALGELLGRTEAAKQQFTAALRLAMSLGDPLGRDRARAGLGRARARDGVA